MTETKLKMAAKLTPKQEAFCLAYIETGNASEAYRRAYNAEKMKPATVSRNASAMIADNKIATRLAELQAAHQERHEITVDSLTQMLRDTYNLAMKDDVRMPAAAVSAVVALGKLHGLIVEKKHVVGEHKVQTEAQPEMDSADTAWIEKMLRPTDQTNVVRLPQ